MPRTSRVQATHVDPRRAGSTCELVFPQGPRACPQGSISLCHRASHAAACLLSATHTYTRTPSTRLAPAPRPSPLLPNPLFCTHGQRSALLQCWLPGAVGSLPPPQPPQRSSAPSPPAGRRLRGVVRQTHAGDPAGAKRRGGGGSVVGGRAHVLTSLAGNQAARRAGSTARKGQGQRANCSNPVWERSAMLREVAMVCTMAPASTNASCCSAQRKCCTQRASCWSGSARDRQERLGVLG